MSRLVVVDLGLSPEVWLFLSMLATLVLFFKFGRIPSIRNLDLLLLFAPAPGLMRLVGSGDSQPWWPFVWLLAGSALWFSRCMADLAFTRRPLLEPNLNLGGLALLTCGMLGLVLAETMNLTAVEGSARNPAEPHAESAGDPSAKPAESPSERTVKRVLKQAPHPALLKRVFAALAHVGLAASLIAVGWIHFDQPFAGLAMAAAYLISPYARIAVTDTGQLVPSALIVSAILAYRRPLLCGALVGLAASWMPAAIGLLPLWFGFFRGRGSWRFLAASGVLVLTAAILALSVPALAEWARALGARSLAEAGLLPGLDAPSAGSFWTGVDPAYRLPVLIAYLALVGASGFWPWDKDLAHLIAQSAYLLVASQFWYLDEGGTLMVLYLPLLLLMIFRPNLSSRRPPPLVRREPAKTLSSPAA